MTFALTSAQQQQYQEEGYVVLRGIIPPEHVEAHKTAVNTLIDNAVPHGGLEIPWINQERRIPERLGQLLRPDWIQPAFVDAIEHGPYLPIAEQILNAPVRYSLFGMLAGGDGKPYIQGWHRDLSPAWAPEEEAINRGGYHLYTQINAPLFPDRFVQIVPGSHLRASTEAEREALQADSTNEIPGQITVELEPGDVAFYYSNLWHRGFNPHGELRWTMHHAFVRADSPVCAHETGQDSWIKQPGYLESLPPRLCQFMQRYVEAVTDEAPSFLTVAKEYYEKSQQ